MVLFGVDPVAGLRGADRGVLGEGGCLWKGPVQKICYFVRVVCTMALGSNRGNNCDVRKERWESIAEGKMQDLGSRAAMWVVEDFLVGQLWGIAAMTL